MNMATDRHAMLFFLLFSFLIDMYHPSYDPNDFRITGDDAIPCEKVELLSTSTRQTKRFLPPLPEDLFRRLVALPGKCLPIYMIAYRASKMERSKTVSLTTCTLNHFGISRSAKRTALDHLSKAGLLRVEYRDHRNPRVTILDAPSGRKARKSGSDA